VNRRSDNRPNTVLLVAGAVVLVIVAALIYWFAIRDDGSKTASSTQTPRGDQTFVVPRVPFTFKYPGNFALAPTPSGFLWIAGVGPYDILDVKRLANSERSLKAARSETQAALQVRPGLTILGDGTETLGATKAVRFTVNTVVNGQTLRSTLYYFSLHRASWQVECQSTTKGQAAIEAACAKMADTFSAN
jgi:hypothetical protein